MRTIFYVTIFALSIISIASCSEKQKYEQLVQKELSSGVRHDSLFLNLELGMSSESFYKICWEMNKRGLIRQGSGNTTVLYEMKDDLKFPADLNFYPTFFEDKIYEIPVQVQNKGWAPWNKPTQSDSLQQDVLSLFKRWYGDNFIEVSAPDPNHTAYVKVDGNRRISIYRDKVNDGMVWVLFTDLSKEKEFKSQATNKN